MVARGKGHERMDKIGKGIKRYKLPVIKLKKKDRG